MTVTVSTAVRSTAQHRTRWYPTSVAKTRGHVYVRAGGRAGRAGLAGGRACVHAVYSVEQGGCACMDGSVRVQQMGLWGATAMWPVLRPYPRPSYHTYHIKLSKASTSSKSAYASASSCC